MASWLTWMTSLVVGDADAVPVPVSVPVSSAPATQATVPTQAASASAPAPTPTFVCRFPGCQVAHGSRRELQAHVLANRHQMTVRQLRLQEQQQQVRRMSNVVPSVAPTPISQIPITLFTDADDHK